DHLGVISETEYGANGNWAQNLSQYGIFANTSYSIDGSYRFDNGYRPNNDLKLWNFAGHMKQKITAQGRIYVEVSSLDMPSGDLAQYYNQNQASTTQRVKERQLPNVLFGYHHEWSPGSHTLLLASRFDDELDIDDSNPALLFLRTQVSLFT